MEPGTFLLSPIRFLMVFGFFLWIVREIFCDFGIIYVISTVNPRLETILDRNLKKLETNLERRERKLK